MRHIALVLLAACAAMAVDIRAVTAQSSDENSSLISSEFHPTWEATAGGVILHRSKALAATLVENGRTGAVMSNVSDFDLGWAAGPQVELARQFDNGWGFGVRYFSIDGWKASQTLADPGNLRVPLISDNPADYFDTAFASYSSRIYNTELNLSRQFGDRLRLLAGFRWVELLETISAGANSPTLGGTFDYGAANHLYGFQVGADAGVFERGAFRLDVSLKAGVFRNEIGMNVYGKGTNLNIDESSSVSRTSFLGEIGLMAKYRLNGHFSVYGGYELMWIDGVALAGNAITAATESSQFPLINGTAFYHGATTGLEFDW
jgi:hypothetical protein